MSESAGTAIPDSELAARYASEASALGRYALASALFSIAQRAADWERRQFLVNSERAQLVPVIGSTREEHPAGHPTAGRMPSHLHAVGRRIDDTVVADAGSHAPSECAAQLPHGVCGALIGWSDGFTGSRKGWYHLDQQITGHGAVPSLQAIDAMEERRTDATRTDLRVGDWAAQQQ